MASTCRIFSSLRQPRSWTAIPRPSIAAAATSRRIFFSSTTAQREQKQPQASSRPPQTPSQSPNVPPTPRKEHDNTQTSPPTTPPLPWPPQEPPNHNTNNANNDNNISRRNRRFFYWGSIALFAALGFSSGTSLTLLARPPVPPKPGTPEDRIAKDKIRAAAQELPIVKELSADPAWESWDAYGSMRTADHLSSTPTSARDTNPVVASPATPIDPTSEDTATSTTTARPDRITTGPLSGSHGVGGYQRIFHNPLTEEIISVIYFGPATTGWPTIVHGGIIATILDESLGRCAVKLLHGNTGVTASLEIQYQAPTKACQFYVVHCRPVMGAEPPNLEERSRKVWIEAVLKTLDGKTCAQAKGLFVKPKNYVLRTMSDKF